MLHAKDMIEEERAEGEPAVSNGVSSKISHAKYRFLGNNILALDDLLENGGKDAILVELQINTHYQDSIHIEPGYTVTD